jgi:hypothetical protein
MDTGKNLCLREVKFEMYCLLGFLGTALHSGFLLQLVSARQAPVYGCLWILPLGFGYRPNYFLLYYAGQIEALVAFSSLSRIKQRKRAREIPKLSA